MILKSLLIIADSTGTIYSPGAIRFDPANIDNPGIITEIGSTILPVDDEKVIDLENKWILPGFVQGHVHLNQTLFRGLAEQLPLLPWLKTRIWPLEAAHTPASVYASASQSVVEMLKSGVTSALTMETTRYTDAAFQACYDLGLRAVIGTALMDKTGDGVPPSMVREGQETLAELIELHEKWKAKSSGRLQANIAPRFVLSCTENLLIDSADVARKNNLRWHTHVSENSEECIIVKEITGKSNADYFNEIEVLGSNSSLAHGVWLTDDEIEMLSVHQTSILHCPSTNLKMGSGVADTKKMFNSGINIALGSDGAPANNRLDIFEEIRLAALLASWKAGTENVAPATVFGWATIGGAKALGMEKTIGSLEVGKKPDIVVLDPGNFSGDPEDSADIYTHIVFGTSSANVTDVWVDGKQRIRSGKPVEFDEKKIIENFRNEREELLKRSCI